MGAVKYDFEKFIVQRRAGTTWVHVPAASVSYTSDHTIADHRLDEVNPTNLPSLVIGSETATVSMSRYADSLPTDILYPADRVQAVYDGNIILDGDVETVTITEEADPAALRFGKKRRYDISCSVAGHYAHLLSRTVTWSSPPSLNWITRLASFGVYVS